VYLLLVLFVILGWYRPFILKMDSDICDGFYKSKLITNLDTLL